METVNTSTDQEMQETTPTLPHKTHPNYRLWSNYAKFAKDRGMLVADILESLQSLQNLKVLDLGCGEGGTSLALTERGAQVTALDFNPTRVKKLKHAVSTAGLNVSVLEGNAHKLEFPDTHFDCVILQDVLEHLAYPEKAIREIARVLKPVGLIYLSTPNRWSPLNFISDPHWNLPVVSVLPRPAVAHFIIKIAAREMIARKDFAALLSLAKIKRLFKNEHFKLSFVNKKVASKLFEYPTAVVCSDLHFRTVKWMDKWHLAKPIQAMVNDKFGVFNFLINPTWYLIAKKTR